MVIVMDESEREYVANTERRLTALEKDNEHLKEEVERLRHAVNTHKHERQEGPQFEYA